MCFVNIKKHIVKEAFGVPTERFVTLRKAYLVFFFKWVKTFF